MPMILSNQHEMQWSSATPGLLIFLLDQNVGDLQLAQRIVDTVNKAPNINSNIAYEAIVPFLSL